MATDLARMESHDMMMELSVEDVIAQVAKIQQLMRAVMKEGEHFGTTPGCKKPSLYKPGAEKLGFLFRLVPKFSGDDRPIDMGNGHREYIIKCDLYHVRSLAFFGSGVGSCSTMEAKYRYRTGPKESTGEPVPREYWELRGSDPDKAQAVIGGHGFSVAKVDGKWEIVMAGERVEYENPADYYNTVLKMAKKRAHVDAMLTATAASDIFTQDLKDDDENENASPPGDDAKKATGSHQQEKPAGAPEMPKRKSEAPRESQPERASQAAGSSGPKDQDTVSEAMAKRWYAICRRSGIPEDIFKAQLEAYRYKSAFEIKKIHYESLCRWAEDYRPSNPDYAEQERDPKLFRQ